MPSRGLKEKKKMNQYHKRIHEARALISAACSILEEVCADEQDAFDNLPEAFQDGGQGIVMQENIDTLENLIADLENAEEILEQVKQ